MVVLLRPEEVPKDLICTICLSVPLTPSILRPCSHVFCKDCIEESLGRHHNNNNNSCCPVCRCDCLQSDVQTMKDENSFAYRIWSSVMIKCDNHEAGCSWTGSITDHDYHHNQSCRQQQNNRAQHRGRRSDSDQELIDSLEQTNEQSMATIRDLKAALLAQRLLVGRRSDTDQELIDSLERSNADLKAAWNFMTEKLYDSQNENKNTIG